MPDATTATWDLGAGAFASGSAFAALRRMRADQPCLRTEFPGVRPAWNLVRHADIVAALRQPTLYSSAAGGTTLEDQEPAEAGYNRSLLHVDPPEHTRLRHAFQPAFRAGALAGLGASLDAIAAELIARARAADAVDAVRDIAAPMAAHSLAVMLGVPGELRDYFMRLSALMLADTTPDPAAIDYRDLRLPAELRHSFGGSPSRAMMRLLRVASRRERDWPLPEDAAADLPATALEDLLAILSTAGTGMTQNCLVMGLRLLAEHRDRCVEAARAAGPEALTLLVEEVIRIACPLYHVRRTVTADHEVHGQPLRTGDKVLLWLYSGNMDDTVFQAPEEFDPQRSPNPHLSFGRGGPHYCLGAALARMEVASVLRTVLGSDLPVRLLAPPRMHWSNFVRETSSLPVSFGRG